MASFPQPSVTVARPDERIVHPLEQLRGLIRRYVVVEGILAALIFLGSWYASLLLLDYGLFKLFTWDWVMEAGRWLRGAALTAAAVLLAVLLVRRIVIRLTTELSYPALALVLERRYPALLGDRLITAVELADVEGMSRYGYSPAMIRQTIAEARELVGQVAVREVFNWQRLWRMGLVAVAIPLVTMALAFGVHAVSVGALQPRQAAWKLWHITTLLVERDVLLWDTPWPRRALLIPDETTARGLRIARDGGVARLRVHSYRWVIADPDRLEGWRPLLWSDITSQLLGRPVPNLPLALLEQSQQSPHLLTPLAALTGSAILPGASRDTPGAPSRALDPTAWTVDEVQRRLDTADEQFRQRLQQAMGSEYAEVLAVFERLEALAADPAWWRTLRRLETPTQVTYAYFGRQTAGSGPMIPEGDNAYVGELSGLKEDVRFLLKAEDFRTPPRPITLIPPPVLTHLIAVTYEPAYLHHPAPQGLGYEALRGLRQRMPEQRLSLTGDKSILVVPSGTELVLTATTEEPIVAAYVVPRVGRVPGARPGSATPVPLPIVDARVDPEQSELPPAGRTCVLEFRGQFRLIAPVECELQLVNADGIVSRRELLLQVVEDQPPVVELAPDIIRRVGTLYYVTPRARIPFHPDSYLRDDHGLSKVEYLVNYTPEETEITRALRAAHGLRSLGCIPWPGTPASLEAAILSHLTQRTTPSAPRQEAAFIVAQFYRLQQALPRETPQHLNDLLQQPLTRTQREAPLVRTFKLRTEIVPRRTNRPDGSLEAFRWEVDGDYFDMSGLGLEVPLGEVQPRYRVDLTIRATDTNFDTGPKTAIAAEPLRLLVVSPADLLVEIGKEEESLAVKLDDALRRLSDAQRKYAYVRSVHDSRRLEELDPARVRAKDAANDLHKARELVQQTAREFHRIERECIVNQLEERTIAHYGMFAHRLDRVLGDNPLPVSPAEDDELRSGRLLPERTFPQVESLQEKVMASLDEARLADPVLVDQTDQALQALYREVAKIRAILGESQSKDRLIRELTALIERRERIRQELIRWRAELEADRFAKEPALGTLGPILLAKGETRRLKHTIRWRQYEQDELLVRLSVSDPNALQVPSQLKLNFETHQNDFEYEVRAGNQEGDFTITLTPQTGQPITVKVTVK
jgi:hypothetical protein